MKKLLIFLALSGLLQSCGLREDQQTMSQLGQACWPVKEWQPGGDIPGCLVYSDNTDTGLKIIIIDLSTFKREEIEVDDAGSVGDLSLLSHDKVVVVTDKEVKFFSENGTQSKPNPIPSTDPQSMYMELNDYQRAGGQIVLSDWGSYLDNGEGTRSAARNQYEFWVVDPLRNDITPVDLSLPGVDFHPRMLPPIHFSPDQNYVLYRVRGTETYAVYDLQNNNKVLTIPSKSSELLLAGYEPHWLPDKNVISAEFLDPETNRREYYFIDLKGQLTQVTHLPEFVGVKSAFLGNPVKDWSPNLKFLMLADQDHHLFVWDQETSALLDPCLLGSDVMVDQPNPIWLADGDYVYISLRYVSEDPGHRPIEISDYNQARYLLDLVDRTIYEIPDSFDDGSTGNPYGWINWELED